MSVLSKLFELVDNHELNGNFQVEVDPTTGDILSKRDLSFQSVENPDPFKASTEDDVLDPEDKIIPTPEVEDEVPTATEDQVEPDVPELPVEDRKESAIAKLFESLDYPDQSEPQIEEDDDPTIVYNDGADVCPECGQDPCVCGSESDEPLDNSEPLDDLVDEVADHKFDDTKPEELPAGESAMTAIGRLFKYEAEVTKEVVGAQDTATELVDDGSIHQDAVTGDAHLTQVEDPTNEVPASEDDVPEDPEDADDDEVPAEPSDPADLEKEDLQEKNDNDLDYLEECDTIKKKGESLDRDINHLRSLLKSGIK